MNISVIKAQTSDERQQCLAVRKEVFVKQQNIPIAKEHDGQDDVSEHYLLLVNGHAGGVARVRYIDDAAKIERVAILDKFQGHGFGKTIMQTILKDLKGNPKIAKAKLSAQVQALPFYQKLGFQARNDIYMAAGIEHQDMVLPLC